MAITIDTARNDNATPPSGLCGLFNRAVAKRAGQISALGLAATLMSGCATNHLNTDTCMRASMTNFIIVGGGSTEFDPNCGDARMAEVLMRRQNDPVSNALGFLLYLDQNPKARAQLQDRMGDKDQVRIEPKAVADLLASPDTSRYVGVQLYARISPEDRQAVDALLHQRGIDPKAALTLNDDDRRAAIEAERLAREQAAQHVNTSAPNQTPAQAPVTPKKCQTVATSGSTIRLVCGGQ